MHLIEATNGTSIWKDGDTFKVFGLNDSEPIVCPTLAEARIIAAHLSAPSPRRTLRRKAIARRRTPKT